MVHIPFWLTEQHEESVIERVQEMVFLRRQRIDSVAPNLPRDIPPQHCFAFSELAPGKDTATTMKVAVINESTAQKYFRQRNPIGESLNFVKNGNNSSYRIVGVVGNTKHMNLREPLARFAFIPIRQARDAEQRVTLIVAPVQPNREMALLQPIRTGLIPFNAALVGFVAATRRDLAEKNRLCPPNQLPDVPLDWIRGTLIAMNAERLWSKEPDIADWLDRVRLNPSRGLRKRSDQPRVQEASKRFADNVRPGLTKLTQFLAGTQQA